MKKFALIFVVVFCLPFFLVGCSDENEINFYKINALYDDKSQTLDCTQEVVYVNNSDNALNEICFFLYANAFDEGQIAVPKSYLDKAYPNGESFGNISFEDVKIGNEEAEYQVNESKNILTIRLNSQLFPEEKISIEMDYTITLANINHRLGYGDNAVNFGNFFPIACVYEDGIGFVENQFSASGDPFYSDVANFDVNITYPDDYVFASSGNCEIKDLESGEKEAYCVGNNIRDFCFVLSKNFQVIQDKVGEIDIKYYFYDDANAQDHLQTAVKAVETFQDLFGEYPYQQLSIVQTNFCFGGMEYPNLVMISDAVDVEAIDYVIVHEIAHQWWYGVVGNNEYEDSWVDEGLTEFSTALFFERNEEYGLKYDIIMENALNTYKNFVSIFTKINGDVDESMNRNLNQFNTEPEYVNCIYTKGMLLFDNLRHSMSEKKFFACLKDYYKNYKFKNSSSEKLIESFCKSANSNLENYFNAWISGEVVFN